jgi:hypothetical protein
MLTSARTLLAVKTPAITDTGTGTGTKLNATCNKAIEGKNKNIIKFDTAALQHANAKFGACKTVGRDVAHQDSVRRACSLSLPNPSPPNPYTGTSL